MDDELLKSILDNGFKPIATTTMLCEPTFVFETDKERDEAWNRFKDEFNCEGWWYSLENDEWKNALTQYANDFCGGDITKIKINYLKNEHKNI